VRITTVLLLIGLISVLASPGVATGQDPVAAARTQLTTARFHAGELAQRGTAISGTQTHIQHVINCLEGDKGPNFRAAAGYPCQGQGNGILNDLRTAVSAGARGSEASLRFANIALQLSLQVLKMTDVNEAQPYAIVVARNLQSALDALGQ